VAHEEGEGPVHQHRSDGREEGDRCGIRCPDSQSSCFERLTHLADEVRCRLARDGPWQLELVENCIEQSFIEHGQ